MQNHCVHFQTSFFLGANSPTSSAPPRCPSACATAGARSTTCWPRTGMRTRWWARGSWNSLLCSRCCFWIWQKWGAFKGDDGWHSRFFSFLFLHILSCTNFPQNTGRVGVTLSVILKIPASGFLTWASLRGVWEKRLGINWMGWGPIVLWLVHCAMPQKMHPSIHFLVKLWKKGINSNSVHLLSSCVISWFMLVKNVFLTG